MRISSSLGPKIETVKSRGPLNRESNVYKILTRKKWKKGKMHKIFWHKFRCWFLNVMSSVVYQIKVYILGYVFISKSLHVCKVLIMKNGKKRILLNKFMLFKTFQQHALYAILNPKFPLHFAICNTTKFQNFPKFLHTSKNYSL
jgi:hypothetical protein